jgi:KaiC/GvpD/RAD55 family RecA-like ATPase
MQRNNVSDSALQANLQAARTAAKHGFRVFPLRSKEETLKNGKLRKPKSPHITDWQRKATVKESQIRQWSRQFPDCLFGTLTGPEAGFAVIDLDQHGEKDGFAALAAMGVTMESAITAKTAGGGEHHFVAADGIPTTPGVIAPGVDTKGEGGFIVIPGTVLPDGRTYRFTEGDWEALALARDLVGLQEAPAPLVAALRPRRDAPEPVQPAEDQSDIPEAVAHALKMLDVAKGRVAEAEDGQRTRTLYMEALWMGGFVACSVLTEEEAAAALMEAAADAGMTADYDPDDLHRQIANGLRTGAKFPILWRDPTEDFPERADPDEDAPPAASPFFMDMADLLATPPPPREWHVKDWIPCKAVHMLAGDGGTGKSLLGLQLAVATGTEGEWLGHPIGKPGVAIYYGAEDDSDELHRRFADVCHGLAVDPAEHRGRVLIRSAVAEDSIFATVGPDGKVRATALLRRIAKEIEATHPTLVILDTLANLHALDPNSQEQAKAFIGLLIGIAQRHGCTFVLLAHPSRTGMATGDGDGFSVGWSNAVRSRSYFAPDKDNPDISILTLKKSNYGRRGQQMKVTWADGLFVKVNDEYADASRACHVFLEILDRLTAEGRFYSHATGANYAPARFAEEPEAKGLSKEQFATAMRGMLKDRVLKVEDYQKPDRKTGKRLARGDMNLARADEEFTDDMVSGGDLV